MFFLLLLSPVTLYCTVYSLPSLFRPSLTVSPLFSSSHQSSALSPTSSPRFPFLLSSSTISRHCVRQFSSRLFPHILSCLFLSFIPSFIIPAVTYSLFVITPYPFASLRAHISYPYTHLLCPASCPVNGTSLSLPFLLLSTCPVSVAPSEGLFPISLHFISSHHHHNDCHRHHDDICPPLCYPVRASPSPCRPVLSQLVTLTFRLLTYSCALVTQ